MLELVILIAEVMAMLVIFGYLFSTVRDGMRSRAPSK